MKFLLSFAVLLSSFAQAGATVTHDGVTLELCPDLVFDGGETSLVFETWEEVIPVLDRPDNTKVLESSWSPMTCAVNEMGDLTILIDLPREMFPLEDVPAVATCSATDHKGKQHVLEVGLDLLDASDMACWPRAGTWHGNESTVIYTAPGHDGSLVLPLLPGYDFEDGTYAAKLKSGTEFPGVTCEVHNDGQHMTVYYADPSSDEGYCPVPDGDKGVAKIPFEIAVVDG